MNIVEQQILEYRILQQHRDSLAIQLTRAKAELDYLKKDKNGFVYFAKRPNGLYKIGLTKRIDSRISSLASAVGEPAQL